MAKRNTLLTAGAAASPGRRAGGAGRLLWAAFVGLDGTRGFGEAGLHPITFAEIDAWCRLKRTPLEPHHVDGCGRWTPP